jgi:hypothetical protein
MSLAAMVKDMHAKLVGTDDLGTFTPANTGSLGEQLAALQAAASSRLHANSFAEWGQAPATDYWFAPAPGLAAVPTAGDGWGFTSLVSGGGSTADFLASGDSDPWHWAADAANDALVSPRLFGDYWHARAVQEILGALPTTITLDMIARWATASANETTTWLGFGPAANTPNIAVISDGANFRLSNGAVTDAGAAVDNNWHFWRIQLTAAQAQWWIDGADQGTLAMPTDVFPVRAGFFTGATNRLNLAFMHAYYR